MVHEENEFILTKINNIYQRRISIYNNVLILTKEQRNLCNVETDKEKVIKLINTRLQLINSVETSNSELNSLKNTIIDNLDIKEFRIGLIKEKIQSTAIEELADTLAELGQIIKNINEIDNEIRQYYDSESSNGLVKFNANPQKAHQAYRVFLKNNNKEEK